MLVRISNMWSSRIKALFLMIYEKLVELFTSEGRNYQRIELTDGNGGLYLKFPNPEFKLKNPEFESEFELVNTLGEASTIALSLDEARTLLAAIASACDHQELGVAQIGYMRVKIDARPNPKHPDWLIIRFGPPFNLITDLNRQRMMSACEEFSRIFGPISTSEETL